VTCRERYTLSTDKAEGILSEKMYNESHIQRVADHGMAPT